MESQSFVPIFVGSWIIYRVRCFRILGFRIFGFRFWGLGSWGKFVLGINRNWDKINSIKLRQIALTLRLMYRVTLITVVSLG